MFDGAGAALYNDHSWWPCVFGLQSQSTMGGAVLSREVSDHYHGTSWSRQARQALVRHDIPFRPPMNPTGSRPLLLRPAGLAIQSDPMCPDSDLRKEPTTGWGQERRP